MTVVCFAVLRIIPPSACRFQDFSLPEIDSVFYFSSTVLRLSSLLNYQQPLSNFSSSSRPQCKCHSFQEVASNLKPKIAVLSVCPCHLYKASFVIELVALYGVAHLLVDCSFQTVSLRRVGVSLSFSLLSVILKSHIVQSVFTLFS